MKLIGKVVPILLAILAIASAASIGVTTKNYREGMGAATSLRFELSNLELNEGDEQPTVVLTFQLENRSLLDIELEKVHFSLYLNREFVGSNYEPFSAMTLGGFEETVLRFRIPLQSFYLQHVQNARDKGEFSWSLRGSAKVVLPFRDDVVWLDLRESWSGE